jgi:hypothetical protein
MAIESILCPVLGGSVTRVTGLEGEVQQIICEEYDGTTGRCRLKAQAREGGPLAQLLDRVREHTLDTRGVECSLRH